EAVPVRVHEAHRPHLLRGEGQKDRPDRGARRLQCRDPWPGRLHRGATRPLGRRQESHRGRGGTAGRCDPGWLNPYESLPRTAPDCSVRPADLEPGPDASCSLAYYWPPWVCSPRGRPTHTP